MDKRALKILSDTFWGPNGWKPASDQNTNPEDFEYAKAQGVMFEPAPYEHDLIINEAISIREKVDSNQVANAFVRSLATRELHYRSALGSYALLMNLPQHDFIGSERSCTVCGIYKEKGEEDLNILNFERTKWGGVRHLQPLYAAFDLQQFLKISPVVLDPRYVDVLVGLLSCIETAPLATNGTTLERHLSKVVKSNKAERDKLVGILGIAGILEATDHRGFRTEFIPSNERELPARRFVDMDYPACWWTRRNGVDHEAVNFWFGHLL